MRPKFLQPNNAAERPENYSTEEHADTVHIDNDLARKAQQGDLAAFEVLFSRHHKRVYNIALRMLDNEAEAADATQEIFVRAYKSISKLVSEEAFVTWLKTMAVNICRDILRKCGRVRLESLDAPIETGDGSYLASELADWSTNPERSFDKTMMQETVQNAIRTLSCDYREVITLFYVDGADVAEIAKLTGCPTGTVKSRLSRARAELKRKLECYVRG
ncbi:MAG: RNA polymerase sigma factor [Armatimonadota bacterium]